MKNYLIKRFIIIILIIVSICFRTINAEPLIEIDLLPVRDLKKINSIALFRFDGKLVNSGRINLVNYLGISYDYYRSLLKRFSNVSGLEVTDTDKIISFTEEDELRILRSKDIPEYDEKVLSVGVVISKEPVKAIDVFLYGKINKFYEGRTFETSYIDITIYLVDSKSKVIYWTTGIRGCLKYVSEALVSVVTTGDYSRPISEDIEGFAWVNPYQARIQNWSLQYRLGYFIMMGELGDRVDNGGGHNFALDFKLPLYGNLNIYNQVELTIISSFHTIEENDPLRNYTYNTFVPLMFNFIYRHKDLLRNVDLTPFAKVGLGVSYNEVYYSGLKRYQEPDSSLKTIMSISAGIEYRPENALNILGVRFRIDRLGLLSEIGFFNWFGTELSSSAMNFSFGIKYYF